MRNRSTEWRVRSALMRSGTCGWKMNAEDVPGKPDFAFHVDRLAVFVDGCFWHGCPKCKRTPSSNTEYWEPKIRRNRVRDVRVGAQLRRKGWRVIRFWEHEVAKSLDRIIGKILLAIPSQSRLP
jgi:DNA mismatch endonuclease Vsr